MSKILKDYKNLVTSRYNTDSTKGRIHRGIDVVGEGYAVTDITAHSDGEVVGVVSNITKTDTTSTIHSYGNYVKIKHDNGMFTLYAHLKAGSVSAKVGDKVKAGQVIGRMGATGYAFGIHLHFEVRDKNNTQIDPTAYIDSELPNETKPVENETKPVENETKPVENETKPVENETEKEAEAYLLHLVKRTIRGDFGNGDNRKRILGNNYDIVQKQVDLNYKHKTTNWDNIKLYTK